MTIKIAFAYNSKGYNRDFAIIQRVHCDCKGYCTLHKKYSLRERCHIHAYTHHIKYKVQVQAVAHTV